jgi:hypothetical protein
MCSCRSLVSSVVLFLCLANMQPTLTAFSMNSCASVCKSGWTSGSSTQLADGQGTCSMRSTSGSSAYMPWGPDAARQSLTRRPRALQQTSVRGGMRERGV